LVDESIKNENKNIPKLMDFREDSLQTIIKMMEYVLKRHHLQKEVSESDIKEEFKEKDCGENIYWLFNQYMGDDKTKEEDKYAIMKTPSLPASQEAQIVQLTTKGLRQLFELKRLRAEEKRNEAEEKRNERIKWATIVMAIFTGFQAIPYIWPLSSFLERCCIVIPYNIPTIISVLFVFGLIWYHKYR